MKSKPKPTIDPWDKMAKHLAIVEKFQAEVVSIWDRAEQSIEKAEEVLALIELSERDFSEISALQDDDAAELAAHIEDVYANVRLTASGNLRVANGLNPVRTDGYSDDFIGPTGYIPF